MEKDDLPLYNRILFWAMMVLIYVPIFGSLSFDVIATRTEKIYPVIIAAFGALGTLIGWLRSIEQWGKKNERDNREDT